MDKYVILLLVALYCTEVLASHAHLNYPDWWKPDYETDVIESPAPPNLEARQKAFAERNSPENIEKLAKEFFGLIDLNRLPKPQKINRVDKMGLYESRWPVKPQPRPTIKELLERKDYQGALDAYRDLFVERLVFPPDGYVLRPEHPTTRFFIEFIHQPDELLENVARFTMLEKEGGKSAVVRLNMGEPGRINWTWYPPQFETYDPLIFPRDGSFIFRCARLPYFYDNLLNGYLESGDPRYLRKWCEFIDDRSMNLYADARAAGIAASPGPGQEGSVLRIFTHLSYVARKRPEMAEHLSSATLARMLKEMWSFVPTSVRVLRETSSNRSIEMYSSPMFRVASAFPEFLPSQYALREKIRTVEAFPTITMMPDGSDIENEAGYNSVYLRASKEVRDLLDSGGQPKWVDLAWWQELSENLDRRATYLLRRKQNNGWEWYPTYYTNRYHGEFSGPNPAFGSLAPGALMNAENRRVISAVFEDGSAGEPTIRSIAWPYSGQYLVRESWAKDAQYLYMQSPRPYNTHTWKNANDVQLFGFGQPLLTLHTWGYGYRRSGYAGSPNYSEWEDGYRKELQKLSGNPDFRGQYQWEFTPLFVDGLPQIGHEVWDKLPFEFRSRPGPQYGKNSAMAYHTPLKNRWHESDHFNFIEGEYAGPFAAMDGSQVIEGVSHRRQIAFLRDLGLWVFMDRARSESPHRYKLDWKPAQPFRTNKPEISVPGFTPDQVVASTADHSVKTANPESANISIYMHSPAPLSMYQYGAEFEGAGEQLVVSAIYPRRTMQHELQSIRTLGEGDVTGFEALLPEGGRVICLAAASGSGELVVDGITATGEALIVAVGPDGTRRGMALGCKSLAINGAAQQVSASDFEFALAGDKLGEIAPIYRPMDLVEILPAADHFSDTVEISMRHPEPGTVIRYTLDGTDPTIDSPVFDKPFTLKNTTIVKARAFRAELKQMPPDDNSGTKVSHVLRARYVKRPAIKAESDRALQPGLRYSYHEGDWTLGALLVNLPPAVQKGTVPAVLDLPHRNEDDAFLYIYEGYIRVPQAGVYTFHAPRELVTPTQDAGFDLRLWVGKEEWYPQTRLHNHGNWSVPLEAGLHAFKVVYVDQRNSTMAPREKANLWRGDKPALEITGPGLERQPIPAAWLGH